MSLVAHAERQTLAVALAAMLLAAAGATLVALVWQESTRVSGELAAAREAHAQFGERLARAALAGREREERAPLYRRMRELNIVGSERRLEWVETLARIREQRALPELRYQIAPRRLLRTAADGPEGVASYASTLTLEAALLHEGDLLDVLADLRRAGGAYYAVRHCAIERGERAAASGPLAARLRARCDIDLVTIHVGGAPVEGGKRHGGAADAGGG